MPDRPVFRFAPSPNGELHLGHALSALVGYAQARAAGGRFLVRIEDIDGGRTRPEFVAGIIEDLHWLDPESQECLDALVEGLGAARLMLLVDYRPEYRHAWAHRPGYTQVRVDPLPADSAGELIDALLGTHQALAPLKQALIDRTDGNPFFLEESVRALAESGALAGDPGAYRLARPLSELAVPATVQAVLAARIDRLGPDDKALLQTAAVLGKTFVLSHLRAVSAAPEPALRHALRRLQAGEFIHEARLFPDIEYTFKHALTHAVAYEGLLAERTATKK